MSARRLTALAVAALLGASALAGCSEDGSFTLPSGDQLKQMVDDGSKQANELKAKAAEARASLEGLTGDLRGTAEKAVGQAQGAADQAKAALDAARDAKGDAEAQVDAARTALDKARADVEAARDRLAKDDSAAGKAANDALTKVEADLDKLLGELKN
ncbi:hypothetical protein [Sanguibacter sp. HDW7]|uniref:hypothetical protein n=1 Tax=Sanguibacter sp. HDW7 TaxID=2714931 RepID=UPI00140C54E1|nr:hypothetical protein [Sanguibacter sp. HDW7]QIK82231.1 hypothetical protein G7063_00280 [Sanguibacter sp. HDW7]